MSYGEFKLAVFRLPRCVREIGSRESRPQLSLLERRLLPLRDALRAPLHAFSALPFECQTIQKSPRT
jgi:hypothetical protein